MAELQTKEHKMELEKVTEELNKFKKRYAAEQKAALNKKADAATSVADSKELKISQAAAPSKFVGGGFRMSLDS